MPKFLLFCCLVALSLSVQAQKISYALPKAYRNTLSASDYKLVVDSAVAQVSRRAPVASVAAGTIRLRNGQQFPLDNLLTQCQAEPDRTAWGGLIRHHFTSLFSSFDAQVKLDYRNFESMRPFLSVRVYPESALAARGGAQSMVWRTDLPGTATVLMLDLPGAFSGVPKPIFEQWHQEASTVFAQALANIAKQPVEKITKEFDAPNNLKVKLHFLGNEDYAASYALDLAANAPEFVGEWGCALAMPNKGLVTACAISRAQPLDFVQYIQLSQVAVAKAYQEHAQPISPEFYWYYQGKFTRIVVVTDKNGRVNVVAPLGLSALMVAK
jgi:hypothetical protein